MRLTVKLVDGTVEEYSVDRAEPKSWWAGNHPTAESPGWELIDRPSTALHIVGPIADFPHDGVQDIYYPLASVICWWIS